MGRGGREGRKRGGAGAGRGRRPCGPVHRRRGAPGTDVSPTPQSTGAAPPLPSGGEGVVENGRGAVVLGRVRRKIGGRLVSPAWGWGFVKDHSAWDGASEVVYSLRGEALRPIGGPPATDRPTNASLPSATHCTRRRKAGLRAGGAPFERGGAVESRPREPGRRHSSCQTYERRAAEGGGAGTLAAPLLPLILPPAPHPAPPALVTQRPRGASAPIPPLGTESGPSLGQADVTGPTPTPPQRPGGRGRQDRPGGAGPHLGADNASRVDPAPAAGLAPETPTEVWAGTLLTDPSSRGWARHFR